MLGHEASRRRIEAAGATFRPFRTLYPDMDSARPETDPFRDWEVRSTLAAGQRLRDKGYLEPIHPAAVESAEAIAEVEPEVAVFDFMLVGAAIAAEAAGVPAVAMVHCPYLLPTPGVPPYGFGLRWPRTAVGRGLHAVLRRVGAKTFGSVGKAVNAEREALGLGPLDDWVDQLLGVARLLVFTAPDLDFAGRVTLPDNVRYVGPAFEQRDETWTSPWPTGDDRPLVVISLSTTYMRQEDLAARILEAVAELPVRAVLTAGPALDTSALTPGDNTVVVPFVPHRAILPEASLMVSHAGWGSDQRVAVVRCPAGVHPLWPRPTRRGPSRRSGRRRRHRPQDGISKAHPRQHRPRTRRRPPPPGRSAHGNRARPAGRCRDGGTRDRRRRRSERRSSRGWPDSAPVVLLVADMSCGPGGDRTRDRGIMSPLL